ncbi:MAG: hypothetical protein ACI9FJ_002489 [Alteromonadaceae bacterium]|jgi:hypothetical protein
MTEKTINVLSSETLTAKYNENAVAADKVFFIYNSSGTEKGSLTKAQVQDALLIHGVAVTPHSDKDGRGLFAVGPKINSHFKLYNWYYSLSLYPTPEALQRDIYKLLVFALTGASLVVAFSLDNQSNVVLTKTDEGKDNPYYADFPDTIEPGKFKMVTLKDNANEETSLGIKASVSYTNLYGEVTIDVDKTFDKLTSSLKVSPQNQLVGDVEVVDNRFIALLAKLTVAENSVLSTLSNVQNFLVAISGRLDCEQVKTPGGGLCSALSYNKASQVFNLRMQLKPFAIIYCQSTAEVSLVYQLAIANNLVVRVRSGGHDHEGECSGTDTIVIDLSRLDSVDVDTQGVATIGPGNKFVKLTTDLAQNEPPVMIPHGTCATVGIGGFILGGGWGPWTRAHGMCCEYLVGATVVLGDGEIKTLSKQGGVDEKRLLWALAGGGGFSYGIVTELKIQTFALPLLLLRFEVQWNPYTNDGPGQPLKLKGDRPTKDVLKEWEDVINAKGLSSGALEVNNQLIGTNLKVSGITEPDSGFNPDTVSHNCIMYGYWDGTEAELNAFIIASFEDKTTGKYEFNVTGTGGAGSSTAYGSDMMSNWDRDSLYNVQQLMANQPVVGLSRSEPLPPDYDGPAPHKITSRLVNHEGLDEEGYSGLLKSLTSPLILKGNRELGLFTYVTLGAISGMYYGDEAHQNPAQCSFPYKDRQYTIQYQTWWNESLSNKDKGQDNEVYNRVNRAMDWMQESRDAKIDGTSGAFISFKDSSIPTETYFEQNYEKLIAVKKDCSKDPLNHFRSRKTII